MVRGTPRTLLDLPRHYLDHPKKFKLLTKVAPKDLLRPPRHIPDDPKQLQKNVEILENFGSDVRGPNH